MNKRTLGFSLSLALGAVSLVGCGLGSAEEEPGGTPQSPLDKTLCHTDLEITGVMTPAPKPTDPDLYDPTLGETNCWPVGEWKFTARPKAANEDGSAQCATTTLLPEYKITGTKNITTDGNENYVFNTNPSAHVRLKVSSGGGGLCEGVFEIYSDDGKVLHNLHPALMPANGAATNPLLGHGEFQMFEVDQWIPQS